VPVLLLKEQAFVNAIGMEQANLELAAIRSGPRDRRAMVRNSLNELPYLHGSTPREAARTAREVDQGSEQPAGRFRKARPVNLFAG